MKNSKSLLAALVLASASLGSSAALAADISSPPQALTIVDTSAFFGDAFAMNNSGNTFMDHFTFTVGSQPTNLDAIISSISRTAATGLDITGLGLYTGAGALVTAGGRVLTITGLGDTLDDAQRRSLDFAARVTFDDKQFRTDIGWRELARAGANELGPRNDVMKGAGAT